MSHVLAPLRLAYAPDGPEAAVAPEAGAQAVEHALLRQMRSLLDAMPTPSPSRAAVAAAEAEALRATAPALAAVRSVYAAAPPALGGPLAVEAALMAPVRQSLDRALRGRAAVRPSESVLEAVLARAAEASVLDAEPDLARPDAAPAEAAVLRQSGEALARLPRHRPSPAATGAVLTFAAQATAAVRTAGPLEPERGAPVVAPALLASSRRTGWLAGSAALLAAAVLALVAFPRSSESPATADAAQAPAQESEVAAVASPEVAPAPMAPAPSASEPSAAPSLAGALATAVERRAPHGPSASDESYEPVARRPARAAAPTRASAPEPVTLASESAPAGRQASPPEPVPAWDSPDDVRAITLRLEEIGRGSNGWEEPIEALGAPASNALTGTPALRSVREGVPTARARLHSDSSQDNQ